MEGSARPRDWQPRRRLRATAAVVITGIALLAVFAGVLRLLEEQLLYFPVRYPLGEWDPGRYGFDTYEDVWFEAADGTRLHGWYFPPAGDGDEDPAPALLWSHGNAGNIGDRLHNARMLLDVARCHLLLYDYRGFGRSEGSPDEEGLYADAEAAYLALARRSGAGPERTYLFGRSLGGAVAVELALRRPVAGLIIESSFTSIRDMAAAVLPFVPRFVVPASYPTLDRIARIEVPLLVFHGDGDEIVPFAHGERLVAAAARASSRELVPIPGAGHNDTYVAGGPSYFAKIRDFLKR